MRFDVVLGSKRHLARGVALLLVCGSAAGCSSTASRFDSLFTGSTASAAPAAQTATAEAAPALVPAPAGPVTRSALAPPTSATVASAAVAPRPTTPKVAATDALAPTVKPLGSPESRAPTPTAAPGGRLALASKPKPAAKPVAEAKAKAEQPKAAKTEASYTVAAGDSLNKIAKKTGVSVAELRAANTIGPDGITVGQKLALSGTAPKPAGGLDPVKTASTPSKPVAEPVAFTPPQPAKEVLKQAESESAGDVPDATGAGKMRWPVRGRVVARYGAKGSQSSEGLDIAVPEGTPVKAAENGVVIYAGNGLKEFGNTVLVRHDDGLVTVYGHASQLKVTRGEKVTRGQDIALSGMSGTTDTPKLHFEVRKNSAPVDPSTYLQ